MKSAEKFLLTLAAGVVVGASLGILFAPSKGTKTRRKIKREVNKYINNVQHSINEAKLKAKAHQLESKVEKLIHPSK